MRLISHTLCVALAVGTLSRLAVAAVDPDVKCRVAIGAGTAKAAKLALKAVTACHKARDKKGGSTDCNQVGGALGKMQKAIAKAIAKGCKQQTCQLALYGSDPAARIASGLQRRLELGLPGVLGLPDLGGDKQKLRCHKTIVTAVPRVASADFAKTAACEKTQTGNKCSAATCAEPDGDEESLSRQDIIDACGSLTGADVGSCTPLPTCAIERARSIGLGFSHDAFTAVECGNGKTETGEQCDDGNTDDTDACTNGCRNPACGDGFVQPGAGEQCDDGNTVDTDDCAGCHPNVCGDGFKKASEACDDGNTAAGDGCSPTCAIEGVACGANGLDATVVLAHAATDNLKGIEFNLSYPGARATLPGSGQFVKDADPPNNTQLGARVTHLQPDDEADDLATLNDQDSPIASGGSCDPVDGKGACPRFRDVFVQGPFDLVPPLIAPGEFVKIRFDCASGATFIPADFPYLVTGSSNPFGQTVTVACSVELAPAP